MASGRGSTRRETGGESAMLSIALQDALVKLKQQERATAARAEASERLADQIVGGLTSGLVVVDRGGMVQAINPAARRILGLREGGAGLTFRQVLKPANALSDLITEALEGTSPNRARDHHVGRRAPAAPRCHRVADYRRRWRPAGRSLLFTDLTAVVELEEQLRLKEALARLGELTAGLAHEFRNGLATIHGYGRLLDPDSLPEQARTCVNGFERRPSRSGGGHELPPLRPARATDACPGRFARGDRRERSTMSRMRVRRCRSKDRGERERRRRAAVARVQNLIRNSLEACADAGIAPRVTIRTDITATDAHVVVEDNGPGFTPESLSKVFQPFATTKANGTGLGLAIVQKVIVSHNGHITASNHADGGAQFRLRVPLASRA